MLININLQSLDDDVSFHKADKNFNKILALRDAFSQTSDTETKYYEEQDKRHAQRKAYDHRRLTTEGLIHSGLSSQLDEANQFMVCINKGLTRIMRSAAI